MERVRVIGSRALGQGGGGAQTAHRRHSENPIPATENFQQMPRSGVGFSIPSVYAGAELTEQLAVHPMHEKEFTSRDALSLDINLRTSCTLIGEGHTADREWTKAQFIDLCRWLLNDNYEHDFMLVYRDSNNEPHFTKAKKTTAPRRITWAWETISGKPKSKVGIGFYPSNGRQMSRWAAIDFDAHDGETVRARAFAVRAFEVLLRNPRLYLVLTTSGSKGWHLFILTEEFYPVEEWTRFLKQLASRIEAPIQHGCCELFPNEAKPGSWPYGIRAPGTWNPKTDELGLIYFNSTGPLLSRISIAREESQNEREKSPFLYHSIAGAAGAQLNDSKGFYSGGTSDWQRTFAIVHGGTRHEQLRRLVHTMLRQVGYPVGRRNAEAQYLAARVQPRATLAEHLNEFDELWAWNVNRWREELLSHELDLHDSLTSETERDLFRVIRNFARFASEEGRSDFPFPIQHVASRLGVTFQHLSKLRQKFADAGLIQQTVPARTNSTAARFRWCLPL